MLPCLLVALSLASATGLPSASPGSRLPLSLASILIAAPHFLPNSPSSSVFTEAADEPIPEIVGGRKKRRKFGMDGFVVNEDGVIADTIQEKLDTGIITDDTLVLEDADKKARDEEERKKSERKPSMVKLPGRDEYLLLPDRESVLRFEPIDDFAVETDVETQNAQVSTHTHRKKKERRLGIIKIR